MKRFTFNLKWVFIGVALACVTLAAVTYSWRQQIGAKRILGNKHAISTFRNPGGKWTGALRKPKSGWHVIRGDFQKVVGFLQPGNDRLNEHEIRKLLKLPSLERIDLSQGKLNRWIVNALVDQEHIFELYLGDTDLTDAQLLRLVIDGNVDFIEISGTNVTEEGISRIVREFPSFKDELEIKTPMGRRRLRKIQPSELP